MRLRTIWVCLSILGCAAFSLFWVSHASADEEQVLPESFEQIDIPPAPVVSPEASLEKMKVAPGFRVELVAAEPLVQDPVAMRWDGNGRMWIVEMRGFMPNVDGENEQRPVGKIAVLEDTDGDGRMDKRTTYLDGLVMPRAIALVEGGVLVAEPPNLWYCRDTDGDLKCDEKTLVDEDYGRQGPVEHTDNGLMHGLDNWMYNAKSARKLRFFPERIEEKNGNEGVTPQTYLSSYRFAPTWKEWGGRDAGFVELSEQEREQIRKAALESDLREGGSEVMELHGVVEGAPKTNAAIYAARVIRSDAARRVRLLAGSDDSLRVWINGERVMQVLTHRGAQPDQNSETVQLKKGRNVLLAEVSNNSGGWSLAMRFESPNGTKLALSNAGKLTEAASGSTPLAQRKTHFRGQWGITEDDFGRKYYNTNSSYLHADLFHGTAYLLRNPDFESSRGVAERIVRDQTVYPIRVNPGINRGYRDGMLREDGRLRRTTAVCGPTIYRGDRYPAAFHGNAFVPEPSGNCIARFIINEKNNGIGLDTKHVLYDDTQWGKREFLASTDERFRPVNSYTGPDGCVYVVDMYRGILQHKVYVTQFLREQILERGLDKPLGLGRIYRIVPVDEEAAGDENERPRLNEASSRTLVNRLSHPNGWWRDTAQRLLVQRRDTEAIEPLRSVAVNGSTHLGRLHALWTLHGMQALDGATVLAGMSDPHPKVRAAAVRTGEALLGTAAKSAFASQLIGMTDDPSPHVRLQVMFTLGQLNERPEAEVAMATLLTRHADNRHMRHAALSGLADREPRFTRTLLRDADWAEPGTGRKAVLRNLGAAVFRGRAPQELTAFLKIIADQPTEARWRQAALLDGMVNAEKNPKPIELDATPDALGTLAEVEHETIQQHLKKLQSLLKTPGGDDQPGKGDDKPAPLTAAQKKQYAMGKALYQAICMACHQAHGKGQPGMAPSLIGTPWVLGSEERLTRIVLDGLQGPITIDGDEWNLVMPGHRQNPILSDQRIAAILTYVRRTWGNEAPPVDTETVERIRKATKDRKKPWSVKELKKLAPDEGADDEAE